MTMTQKEFTTPVKVENFGDTRKIWATPAHSRGLYCCSDIVAVIGGRVAFVGCSLESNNAGVDAMNS
jgi:hypothetical protein